jgi:biopolymer transport protein TolR
MQVSTGSRGSALQSEINVTPLVDVVLVLLIIFMVVIPLAMTGYDAENAKTSAEVVPALSQPLQVTLHVGPSTCNLFQAPAGEGLPADCRVTLNDQEIPATALPARIAEAFGAQPADKRVLFVAADDRLNYEGVLRIVDLAKSSVADLSIEFIAPN